MLSLVTDCFNIGLSIGKVENTYRDPKSSDWRKLKTLVGKDEERKS